MFGARAPITPQGVYIIRNSLRYIINAKHCISSIPQELHIIKTLVLYIINFVRSCISSLRKFLCTPKGVMRYNDSNAIVDDMPLLSQWIKKFQVRRLGIFWARVHGKDATQFYPLALKISKFSQKNESFPSS